LFSAASKPIMTTLRFVTLWPMAYIMIRSGWRLDSDPPHHPITSGDSMRSLCRRKNSDPFRLGCPSLSPFRCLSLFYPVRLLRTNMKMKTDNTSQLASPAYHLSRTNWRSAPSALLLHFPFWSKKGCFLSLCPYVLALFRVNPALNATPFPLFDPLLSNLTDLPDLADLDDFYALGQNLGILGILADLGDLGDPVTLFVARPGETGRFADLGESGVGEIWEFSTSCVSQFRRFGDLQIWENL